MPVQTYGDVWRLVALHVPAAPTTLVQAWVQIAYDTLLGKRHWNWLRREVVLTTLAQRSIAITFTQNSTAITSAALFVASDAGRQLRAGSDQPVYTIDTFTDASNAVLTQAYAGVSGAVATTVHDRYLVMPADFRSILDVTDMTIQRPIAWWIGRDRLDLFDPGRISSDTRFRVLVAYQLSQRVATLGQVMYEAWPSPTGAGSYLLRYFQRTDTLTDDTTLQGVIATYTDALRVGALAEAAQWPGTATQKNPYFNLRLATELKGQFLQAVQTLGVMDDDQYLQDLMQIDLSKFGLAALSADTTLMRQSDATLADYY